MALINKAGLTVANLSQPFKVFATEADYTAWIATLPNAAADVVKFAVIKRWKTPMVLQVNSEEYAIENDYKAIDFSATKAYAKDDIVVVDGKIYRAKAAVTPGALDLTQWEVLSFEPTIVRDYVIGEAYVAAELIYHDGDLWRARAAMASAADPFNAAEWENVASDNHIVPNFVPSAVYAQYEAIANNGQLYRAKVSFTAGAAFVHADWELISQSPTLLMDFAASTGYLANEMCYYDGQIWRAKADFTSTLAFDEDDWDNVSATPEVYFFDAVTDYPIAAIVVNGTDTFITLKDVPAGTAITDATAFRQISFMVQTMTVAEWEALTVKPQAAFISDSAYDM